MWNEGCFGFKRFVFTNADSRGSAAETTVQVRIKKIAAPIIEANLLAIVILRISVCFIDIYFNIEFNKALTSG